MPVNQPFNVYREQLTSQYHGLALWNPKPIKGLYDQVSIGDVGYLCDGDFIRMFNVKLRWDHPSNTKFRPPKEFKSLDKDFFDNVRGNEFDQAEYHSPPVAKVDNTGNFQAGTPDQAKGQTYTCRARSHGALLSLPHGGHREDVIRTKAFEDYIKDNVVSWFTWAQNNKLGVERMEDLILVTGCTLVTSWAAAAFDDSTAGMSADATSISLDAQKFDRGGAQFFWRNIRGNVEYHNSRFNPNDVTPLPQNQCVFIRGFRAKRTFFGIKPLRAGAEPLPDDDPDNSQDDEIQVTQVPSAQKYRDPLIGVLDYIVEKCIEDAVDEDTIAIVHDDDLRLIDSKDVETLTADEVEKFLHEKQIPLFVEKAAILRDPRDIELLDSDEKKATFYAVAESNGEPVPIVVHPVLTTYLLKLEMAVGHDYDLPKEELTSSAVYPPVLSLKLESCQGYPKVISIEASDNSQGVGVTVQDVLRTIHEDLMMSISIHELSRLGVKDRTSIDTAFGESRRAESVSIDGDHDATLRRKRNVSDEASAGGDRTRQAEAPQKPLLRPPKLAPSAWQLYFTDWIQRHQASSTSKLNVAQAAKEAGVEYARLSPEEKQTYTRRSLAMKEIREREHHAYMSLLTPEDIKRENLFRAAQRKAGKSRRGNIKDPNAPKKPLSAYFMFLQRIRSDPVLVRDVFGDETEMTKQSVLAAEKWRSMTDEERKPFLAQAEQEKLEYESARKLYEEGPAQNYQAIDDFNLSRRRSRSRSRGRGPKDLTGNVKATQSPVPANSMPSANESLPDEGLVFSQPRVLSQPNSLLASPEPMLLTIQDIQGGLLRSNSAAAPLMALRQLAGPEAYDPLITSPPNTPPPLPEKISRNNTAGGSGGERIAAREFIMRHLKRRQREAEAEQTSGGEDSQPATHPRRRRRQRRSANRSTVVDDRDEPQTAASPTTTVFLERRGVVVEEEDVAAYHDYGQASPIPRTSLFATPLRERQGTDEEEEDSRTENDASKRSPWNDASDRWISWTAERDTVPWHIPSHDDTDYDDADYILEAGDHFLTPPHPSDPEEHDDDDDDDSLPRASTHLKNLVPLASSEALQKYGGDAKLFSSPGILPGVKRLEEERRTRSSGLSLNASFASPPTADEFSALSSGTKSSRTPQAAPEFSRDQKLSHQASDTRLNQSFNFGNTPTALSSPSTFTTRPDPTAPPTSNDSRWLGGNLPLPHNREGVKTWLHAKGLFPSQSSQSSQFSFPMEKKPVSPPVFISQSSTDASRIPSDLFEFDGLADWEDMSRTPTATDESAAQGRKSQNNPGSHQPMTQAGMTGQRSHNYNRTLYTSEEEPSHVPRKVDCLNGRVRLQILPKLSLDGSISLPTSTFPTLHGISEPGMVMESRSATVMAREGEMMLLSES